MKLIMTLLVRDEEKILRANIDYHLSQGVDFIIATDNCSLDSTEEILRDYQRQGRLHYLFESNDTYNQHEWVSRMARLAATDYSADWIINNDADEFWWPKKGNLKTTLINMPEGVNVLEAKRRNFVHFESQIEENSFLEEMIFKEAVSLNPVGKPLPPKQAHIATPEIIVKQGNHSVAGLGEQVIAYEGIEIFHFPIRSYKQILNKIVKGGAAYEKNTELPKRMGITWRTLYNEFLENGDIGEYYKAQTYSDKQLKSGLDTGMLLRDERLKKYICELYQLK